MAKINDKDNVQQSTAPSFDFDKAKTSGQAEESITRRPFATGDKLTGRDNDLKTHVICGHLVGIQEMNNPNGADRKDDFWLAAIIKLTHSCQVIENEVVRTAQPGEEVYVGYGSEQTDLARHFEPLLWHDVMFWVALRPNGKLDLKGKNAMRLYEVIVGKEGAYAPLRRTGRYIAQGPSGRVAAQLEAPKNVTAGQVNAARQTVSSLQG